MSYFIQPEMVRGDTVGSAGIVIQVDRERWGVSSGHQMRFFSDFDISPREIRPFIKLVMEAEQKNWRRSKGAVFVRLRKSILICRKKLEKSLTLWKNQPPTSLSSALAQIHRNLGR